MKIARAQLPQQEKKRTHMFSHIPPGFPTKKNKKITHTVKSVQSVILNLSTARIDKREKKKKMYEKEYCSSLKQINELRWYMREKKTNR